MDRSWVPSGVPDDDYSSPSSPPPTYLQRRRHLTDRELEQRSHSPLVGRYPSHSTSSTVHSPAPAGEHQAGLSFTPSASQTSSTELPSSKIQFTPEERYPFLQQEPPSIVQSRERAVSASKSPKGGLSFFRRRSSAAADKQSKKAAVKTPRKSSSPAVFDPQFRAIPYRTSVEILQPLPIPSSTKSHDNPASAKGRKSSSASFLQNVKRKASRVFSKTSNPVSPPAPNVPAPIPVGVSQFRTSSSYSRESPVNSAWEDEPLLTRANHNVGAEQYAELVAELQDLHEDSNPREDSPTLGRQTLTTPHRPRLHRVSSKRRRSVFFEQPKTRTSSTFPRATRGPDSDALGISSGDPFQQSPSPPPRQDSPTAERQRSYLTTSRTSPEVSTRNPFTRNDADSAARLQRRETRRRELDSRRALVESIGYSTPRIPPKTRAPATAAETETSSGSQSQSSFGAPGGSVITQSPLYNRHPAYRRLPPRSESATSTKKPFNEVDFAKPFPRLGVPAPTEGKADLDLDLVDEEEEGEREKKASERAEDASLVRTPGPRRPRERQDRESPGTDAIESTRTGPPQRREEQSSNLRASKAKAGVSVKSPLPSSQQRIEGAAGGKLSDVCQRAERLESIIGGASGAPKTSSVTGEVVPVTSDPTLTTSESIPGISISKRANSNIAGVPTPRRAAGSKVASLLKKFDQPGSSPVVPPSQTRPSEVTKSLPPVESEPNEEDSDSPPLIPRKSSARARKAARLAAEAARAAKEESSGQNSSSKKVTNSPDPSEVAAEPRGEVPSTPYQKEKSLQKGARGEITSPSHSSGEWGTPPELHPELIPQPLFARRPSEQPFISVFQSQDDSINTSDLGRNLINPRAFIMDRLTAVSAASNRQRAQEDARSMQKKVIEMSEREGRPPPNYYLMELIGKGSFGRVYKGKHMATAKVVAIKIIDLDASDFSDQSARSDSFTDFMKEINALKILGGSRAKNINNVIEALSVSKTMWMVSEYCAGGSVATLMKPTPRGLKENWIIPILREVAVAIRSVHDAGIIHRDIKCANVLITEDGELQLCDFGVAGIIESKVDKRSTFIGTPHWMAPELFEQSPSYGKEVDIWAFGSMAYEMATGLPPNAKSGVKAHDLGSLFKQHIPRLEGDTYSEGLKAIVAYCLEEKPSDRPDVYAVQMHSYIADTEAEYPTSSLIDLVMAFKKWEDHGGSRQSLFYKGGARGPDDTATDVEPDNTWNFSTTDAFDEVVEQNTGEQDIINAYGSSVNLEADFSEDTSKPIRQQGRERGNRRRPPPEALAPLKAPIEKVFDQNTIHGYAENSETHYARQGPPKPQEAQPRSDLPLRDETSRLSINESIIDLGEHDAETGISSFRDADTIKPNTRTGSNMGDDAQETTIQDFNRPALSDPSDVPNKRATQDWKFPVMAPPASANAEPFRFPPLQPPSVTPGAGGRPTLHHHPTEPISVPTQSFSSPIPSTPSSPSRLSLIDLDMSIPEPSRPSTADSTVSNDLLTSNPFHWERHASLNPELSSNMREREPSLYLSHDSEYASQVATGNSLRDLIDQSDFSDNDGSADHYGAEQTTTDDSTFADFDYSHQASASYHMQNPSSIVGNGSRFPTLLSPPSAAALTGTATNEDMAAELQRMLTGLTGELSSFREVYEGMGPRRGNGTT